MCERVYAEKKLPCIFRLTSFTESSALDTFLEQRGYAKIDPTLVMHLELSQPIGDEQLELVELSLDEWMRTHARLSGIALDKEETHERILQRIPCDRLFACLQDAKRVVAVGLGVLEEGYFGLFDLLTDSLHRNKGFGTRIVRHMLMWAQKRGARYAYLQVTVANVSARHVYSGFGFQELYRYWYRVPGASVLRQRRGRGLLSVEGKERDATLTSSCSSNSPFIRCWEHMLRFSVTVSLRRLNSSRISSVCSPLKRDLQFGIRFRTSRRRLCYDRVRSNRSRFITLFHTATKSCTNFSMESLHA